MLPGCLAAARAARRRDRRRRHRLDRPHRRDRRVVRRQGRRVPVERLVRRRAQRLARRRDRRLDHLPRRRRAPRRRRRRRSCARCSARTWREAFYLRRDELHGRRRGRHGRHAPGDARSSATAPSTASRAASTSRRPATMPTYLPERFETTDVARPALRLPEPRVQAQGQVAPQPRAARGRAAEPVRLVQPRLRVPDARRLGERRTPLRRGLGAADARGRLEQVGFAPLLGLRGARARRECGRADDARALLEQAIALWPEYTDLTFELALCRRLQGDLAGAERLLGAASSSATRRAATPRRSAPARSSPARCWPGYARLKDSCVKTVAARPITRADNHSAAREDHAGPGSRLPRRAISQPTLARSVPPSRRPRFACPAFPAYRRLLRPRCSTRSTVRRASTKSLRSRGLSVSFDAQPEGGLRVRIVDSGGSVVSDMAPAEALDALSGETPLDDLTA